MTTTKAPPLNDSEIAVLQAGVAFRRAAQLNAPDATEIRLAATPYGFDLRQDFRTRCLRDSWGSTT